nr:endolytic transglycosylase MltG [Saprospiraceae bacterium]
DSITFLNYLKDPEVAASLGYNQDNFLTMFIPNTYEMFWTSTPESFVKRMKKEYDNFWTQDRINKLTANNLTPTEAYIIASIVEKESNYTPEKPVIAGVYLNRLHAGERLQADPTVVFAMGDFSIQRVLYTHLKTDSPYNTYLNTGLPPGPICMPSMASLEAVINVDKHKYMFFCARPDNSGIHVFAETYQEHLKNADNFSKWLNSLNIK